MTRVARRGGIAAAGLLLAASSLAGCGGGRSHASDGGTPYRPLAPAQAREALLRVDDLPGVYTPVGSAGQDGEDGSASQPGCLAATARLDAARVEVEKRSAFVTRVRRGVSGALSQVASDPDPSVLETAFTDFRTSIARCHSVDETDASTRYRLRIASRAQGDEVSLTADGTVGTGGDTAPYHLAVQVRLRAGTLSVVAAYDLGVVTAPLVDDLPHLADLVDRRIDRLQG